MKKFLQTIFTRLSFLRKSNGELQAPQGVEYSVRKYRKAYELLEEYDQKALRDPELLADAGRLRPFIRRLQGKAEVRRAHSSL